MTNNNQSRKDFRAFLNATGFKRSGRRNVFAVDGKKIAYTRVFSDKYFCRQFYEDCDGVLFDKDGKYKVVSRKNLRLDHSPNRVSSKGVRAFTAHPIKRPSSL